MNSPTLIEHSTLQGAKRLLYMTHLAIGDFVYQGVWLRALKAKYPHLAIDIWFDDCRSKPHNWAIGRNKVLVEWIDAIGDFEDVYPIVSNLSERKDAITQAQAKSYDVIVFIGKNRTEKFAKIARQISSSAKIVASKSRLFNHFFSQFNDFKKIDGVFSYDQLANKSHHVTELYAQCFQQSLGLNLNDLIDGNMQLNIEINEEYSKIARPIISSLTDNDPTKMIIFINHLSTATKKDYPWTQVKSLILLLNSKYANLVFIVNTPPDQLKKVTDEVHRDKELSLLSITTFTALNNFFELPAIMKLCDIVISVDTATAHLAVCLGKPQVTLMASNFKLWQPLGESVILEGSGKAKSITPTTISAAFDQQVNTHFNQSSKYQPTNSDLLIHNVKQC